MGVRVKVPKRHFAPAVLALALGLAAVLVTMGVGIALSHEQSKKQILDNLSSKGPIAAGFVSTFVSQQATREAEVARQELSGRRGLSTRFRRVLASFGSHAGVLLDSSGRLLQVTPSAPAILGSRIAPRYAHLTAAESGRAAVSGIVPSAAEHKPVVAIAVPYPTSQGRRVLSVAYPVAGSVLAAFVQHTVALPHHLVAILDSQGMLVTSSSHTSAVSLRQTDPSLARATERASRGVASVAGSPSSFVVSAVRGTPWHVVVAVRNKDLFRSINGWALWLPWIVLTVIAILCVIVLALFSRSLVAHRRLEGLSSELAAAAHTDSLTGLANRRALHERMPQAWAYAQRHDEPLTVMIIDLDDFKEINDTYGHDAGDHVLEALATCMHSVFRTSDIFGRWGGDEFVAFLPGTDLDGANAAGERLGAGLEAVDLSRHGPSEQITLSFGCASAAGKSMHDVMIEADKDLYRAKGQARVQSS